MQESNHRRLPEAACEEQKIQGDLGEDKRNPCQVLVFGRALWLVSPSQQTPRKQQKHQNGVLAFKIRNSMFMDSVSYLRTKNWKVFYTEMIVNPFGLLPSLPRHTGFFLTTEEKEQLSK